MAVDRFRVRPAPIDAPPPNSVRSCRACSPRQRRTAPRRGARSAEKPLSTPLRGSRSEIALVAVALLVPIPLLAASGLHLPLPDPVVQGVASLLPSAEGNTQAAAPAKASGLVSGTISATGRNRPVATRAVSPGRNTTTSPEVTTIQTEDSVRAPGVPGRVRPKGAGIPSGADDSTDVGKPPVSAEPTPKGAPTQAVEEGQEPGQTPANTDQDERSLIRAQSDSQGVSTGVSVDEDGNLGVSPPAAGESGSEGVEVGISPDVGPPVTAGTSLPSSGLVLP